MCPFCVVFTTTHSRRSLGMCNARTRDDDPPVGVLCLRQVTHVGVMVDRHILSDCLVKQKKAFQHRSLPPTLRQVIHAWGWVRGVEGQL